MAALVLVLLLAQWLGLVHRVVHARGAASQHALFVADAAAHADAAGHDAHADDAPAFWFGHDDDAGCVLYDQLTHADAAWSAPAAVLPPCGSSTPRALHRSWHLAAQSAGFLARGPPALS